jgi:hypothetical protein
MLMPHGGTADHVEHDVCSCVLQAWAWLLTWLYTLGLHYALFCWCGLPVPVLCHEEWHLALDQLAGALALGLTGQDCA